MITENRAILETSRRPHASRVHGGGALAPSRRRIPFYFGAALLLFTFHVSRVTLPASTVIGNIADITGGALTNATVKFIPLSGPTFNGGLFITTPPKSVTTDTNGAFSLTLQPGDYRVQVNNKDQFSIAVPNDALTYSIQNLVSQNLTYVYQSPPASVQPIASSNLIGMVKTDSTVAIPRVYLTDTVDTKLATRPTIGSFNSTQFTATSNSVTISPSAAVTNLATAELSVLTKLGALASTGKLVPVCPYALISSGAANFGPSTGQTNLEWITYGQLYRVRQTGLIKQVVIYLPSSTGISSFKIRVWRPSGVGFDLVSSSEDLTGQLVSGATNTLALQGLAASEGDYIGGAVTYSPSASAQNFFVQPAVGARFNGSVYWLTNAPISNLGFNWTGQNLATNVILFTQAKMAAPIFIGFGDSTTSGDRTNYSFADWSAQSPGISHSWVYHLGQSLGYSYQNMGISGDTSSNLLQRVQSDVVDLNPRFVVGMIGVNDQVVSGLPNSTIETNITSLWQTFQSNNISFVWLGPPPVGLTVTPPQLSDLTDWILTNAPLFGGIPVDLRPWMGAFHSGGTAGNLWDQQPLYTPIDSVHPYELGNMRIAQAVQEALGLDFHRAALVAGSARIAGNILFPGSSQANIQLDRSAAGLPGNPVVITAGAAAPASSNQAGGTLVLQGGLATGTGISTVVIQTASPGSAGTGDNLPNYNSAVFSAVGNTFNGGLTVNGGFTSPGTMFSPFTFYAPSSGQQFDFRGRSGDGASTLLFHDQADGVQLGNLGVSTSGWSFATDGAAIMTVSNTLVNVNGAETISGRLTANGGFTSPGTMFSPFTFYAPSSGQQFDFRGRSGDGASTLLFHDQADGVQLGNLAVSTSGWSFATDGAAIMTISNMLVSVTGTLSASSQFQIGSQAGITVSQKLLVPGGTTNLFVFVGGILVSNVPNQ